MSSRELLAAAAAAAAGAAVLFTCSTSTLSPDTPTRQLSPNTLREQRQLVKALLDDRMATPPPPSPELSPLERSTTRPHGYRVEERDQLLQQLQHLDESDESGEVFLPEPEPEPECVPEPGPVVEPEPEPELEPEPEQVPALAPVPDQTNIARRRSRSQPPPAERDETARGLRQRRQASALADSAWVAAMATAARNASLPAVYVPAADWASVVCCRVPGSAEAVGQRCFETELEREWHESRGDHDLTIESWTAREADWVRVGLDYIKCGGASASRTLRYRTDPGLPRPFSDAASVTVAETQVLQQLTTDGSWVVTSVATFEGLPKSDCLRVHTRYYFLAVPPSPAGAAGVPSPGNICAIQILRFTPVLGPHL